MLENISGKLSNIVKTLSGKSTLTEDNINDALREVRVALLEADVSIPVVKFFIDHVRKEALGHKVIGSLTPGQALIGVVNEKLIELMGGFNDELKLNVSPPAIILMAGLQGAGKTTTVGKLAYKLKTKDKKKVLVVSSDIYRPAAIEQLKILAEKIEVEFFPSNSDQKPLDIVLKAKEHAQKFYFDVLIVDTAGRTSIDEFMMNEIKEIHKVLNPIETLFIVDSMLGQDAVNTAKIFNESLNLTGVILTKMDGDGRGGAALSIRHVTGKPIKFIGISEKISGLEPFYPDRLASRILGMGDVLSLIDDVKASIDEQETQKMLNKIKKGKRFDLEDLKKQYEQIEKMGGLQSIMEKMPTQLVEKASGVDGKDIIKNIAIINSMTIEERRKPEILKASRKKRIAQGSGRTVQEVNQLLNQYEQMSELMKRFGSGTLMKAMSGLKHLLPKF